MRDDDQLSGCGCLDGCIPIIAGAVMILLFPLLAHTSYSAAGYTTSDACGLASSSGPPPSFHLTAAINDAALRIGSGVKATAYSFRLEGDGRLNAPPAYVESLVTFCTAYIERVNPTLAGDIPARMLVEAGLANDVDPLILLCIARWESRYNVDTTGAAGERGLLQIHPCHKAAMRKAGLSFDSEADRLTFACMLYKARGWSPWAVRGKAKREYERIQGE